MDRDGNFDPLDVPDEPMPQVSAGSGVTQPAVVAAATEHGVPDGKLMLSVGSVPAHTSRRVMFWVVVFFCAKCGCWGTVKTRHLSKPCTQHPRVLAKQL